MVYVILEELNEFKVDAVSSYGYLFKYFEFLLLIYDYLFVTHFGYFVKSC